MTGVTACPSSAVTSRSARSMTRRLCCWEYRRSRSNAASAEPVADQQRILHLFDHRPGCPRTGNLDELIERLVRADSA